MIQKAARDEKSKLAKRKERMKKKLGQLQSEKQLNDITTKQLEGVLPDEPSNKVGGKKLKEAAISINEEQLKQKDEIAKSEKDRLSENQKTIAEQQNTVASIDEQLAKIQSLYNKLNKKTAEAELSAKTSN